MPIAAFYIGSYSIASPWAGAPGAHGAGVRRADLDLESGEIVVGPTKSELNPSFLARDGQAGLLWTITEPEFGGELICYREETGRLNLIGRAATGADAPCHLVIDRDRGLGFVAHYHGGCVAALSLGDDGRPQRTLALLAPPGIARGEDRGGAHARPHASLLLGQEELLVTDTGRDLVLLYKIRGQGSTGAFELLDALPLPIGSGPRHVAHRRGQDVIYVSNQNSSGVSIVARVSTNEGPRLELRGIVSAPNLGRAQPAPSEIALHPTRDVLYMANREDNSLSIFSVDSATGGLAAKGCVDVMGRNPRHFGISPDGGYLIVANQDSDELTTFRLGGDGRDATWTGRRFAVATPTAVCF
ncbi:MAG TPA: beta-propeller fold lactonase family protein [Roseiarcus sp.]|nr:beta-propeller fold lactonase family protein [Roseiarcus sp.]